MYRDCLVDHFESWRRELERRNELADIRIALYVGAGLIEATAGRAGGTDAPLLASWAAQLRTLADDKSGLPDIAALQGADWMWPRPRSWSAMPIVPSPRAVLELTADRKRAQFSSWYELFPRVAAEHGRHGTFRDVQARLSYMARMGFDVLYMPPIHPIGRINRKGANNALESGPEDVGSPWRSAPRRVATRTSCRSLVPWRTSSGCCVPRGSGH